MRKSLAAIVVVGCLLKSETIMAEPVNTPVQAAVTPRGAAGVKRPGEADVPRVQPTRPPDRKILYKQTTQGPLNLFAYLPADWKAADQRPAMIFFFGGGWAGGTPSQFYHMAEYFAKRGLVTFCAEYRVRTKHGTTPAECVEDARSAIRFVRKHAAEWGVDPNRLISSGGSAGGHLAACVGVNAGQDATNEDLTVSCRPEAMVLFNPVLDTTEHGAIQYVRVDDDALKHKIARDISPILHLDKDCPPGIAFYGTTDAFLGPAKPFIAKAQDLGIRMDLWTAKDMGHGFFNASPWQESVIKASDEFLTSLGYLSGPPTVKASNGGTLTRETPEPHRALP